MVLKKARIYEVFELLIFNYFCDIIIYYEIRSSFCSAPTEGAKGAKEDELKVKTHPWNHRLGNLDNLQTIKIDEVVEIEVPAGKHAAKVVESIIYNEHDGTYLMHDDDFTLGGVKYELYPLAGECKMHHGSAKGGTQTTAWFLVVADKPFGVKRCNMAQDENWGTLDAEINHYHTDSAPIEQSLLN